MRLYTRSKRAPVPATMTVSSRIRSAAFLSLSLLAVPGMSACKSHGSGASDAGDAAPAASASATGLPPPPDVAAPPANATKTPSGLAFIVLTPGTGTDHPAVNDTVKVNYTGWTTDGKMFDSTIQPRQPGRKPEPANLSLAKVIPGWTEGIQLMTVGEKRRFWIPEELAYKGRRGAPAGMLVFEVELLGITPGPKPPADVAAPPPDAEKTKDDLVTKVLQKGTGTAHPQANDGVRVNYSVWERDGKLLDESRDDKPAVRPVTGFSEGWTEGLEMMVPGEKRMFWVPASLAPAPRPGMPPTNDVTMVIELIDILPGPKTPPDVKAPPKDATVEKDGLATKVLAHGTGKVHPTRTDRVTVNYAGWTTDGKMFDASFTRGEPATFPVSGVIAGWSEAIQLMVEGEKRRIWIPEQLAYKGQPNRPQGMLVFDVELLKIDNAPAPQRGPGGMGNMGGFSHPGMGGPGGMGVPGMGPHGAPPPPQQH